MPDHVLTELEREFERLADEIPESPTKQAISVLHGIVMEVWRGSRVPSGSHAEQDGRAIDRLQDLFHTAPPMDQPAVSVPLEAGVEAPEFALPDAAGKLVRLSDFRGTTVVLVFYPLDWSPGAASSWTSTARSWPSSAPVGRRC